VPSLVFKTEGEEEEEEEEEEGEEEEWLLAAFSLLHSAVE
jgi:hypothetical protein